MTFWDRAAGLWSLVPPRTRTALVRLANHRVSLGVVGLIDDGEGRLLVLDHRFRPRWTWGLPGGFVRAGERLDAALEREIREETGLRIAVDPAPFDVEHLVGPALVSVALRARMVGGTAIALSPEIREARWVQPGEQPPETYPHHAALIDGLRKPG